MRIEELDLMLKPSKISGIGVFATRFLPKGARLYGDSHLRRFLIKIAESNPLLQLFCEKYCVLTNEAYICPVDFRAMSIIWYLNHSDTPNLTLDHTSWFLNQDIQEDEELTISYKELD